MNSGDQCKEARIIMVRYFNYDYDKNEYYEVDFPLRDHYTYNSLEDDWYEIILNLRGETNEA